MKSVVASCCLVAFLVGNALAADDPWLGQRVMVKLDGAVKVGNQDVTPQTNQPATVEQVNGDWLWLGTGWLDKEHAVALQDAPAYYAGLIQQNVSVTPPDWPYCMRAMAFRALGEFDDAIEDYNEAIRLSPADSQDYMNRGGVYLATGNFDKAILDFTEAITLDPNNDFAYFDRAITLSAEGETDSALTDCNEAIRIAPNDAQAYVVRGGLYELKPDLDKAWSDYNRALQLDSGNSGALLGCGVIFQRRGYYDQALSEFNNAIQSDPQSSECYRSRAWLRATCPDVKYRDGKAAFDDASTACADSSWADQGPILALAAAYAESGDFDHAMQYIQKAVAMPGAQKQFAVTEQACLAAFKNKQPYRDPQMGQPL